tara:strand:- start:1605 stop:2108 length:504 start_codon:yes stop_codon:yes gene_type:complete
MNKQFTEVQNGLFLKTNTNPDPLINKHPLLDFNKKKIPTHLVNDYYLTTRPIFLKGAEYLYNIGVSGYMMSAVKHYKMRGKKYLRYNKGNQLTFHVIEGDDIEFHYSPRKFSRRESWFGKKEFVTEKLKRGDVIFLTPNFTPFYLEGRGLIVQHEIEYVPEHGQVTL